MNKTELNFLKERVITISNRNLQQELDTISLLIMEGHYALANKKVDTMRNELKELELALSKLSNQ